MTKKTKGWSYSTGERGGNRVRAFEDAKTGIILREWYPQRLDGTAAKRIRTSTGERNRDQAKQRADELAARFGMTPDPKPEAADLKLRQLFDMYLGEVTPHKGSEGKRSRDKRCADMFGKLWGDRKVSSLSRRDWDAFIHGRRGGQIRPVGSRKAGVGDRMIAYDLAFLRSVLNWAAMTGNGKGGYLLEKNPLKGLPLPRELNPQSHAIGIDRYRALLKVGDQVSPFFRPMAALAYETGRRIGVIRLLRWSDVDFEAGRVRWRAENDKTGREAYTPLPDEARRELAGLKRGIGEVWVFPSPGDSEKPCSRHLVRDWWYKAEEIAGVEHLPRTGWHGLRRQFATEMARDGVGLATIATLGGWKEPQTIIRHYMMTDEETMREALERRKKRAVR